MLQQLDAQHQPPLQRLDHLTMPSTQKTDHTTGPEMTSNLARLGSTTTPLHRRRMTKTQLGSKTQLGPEQRLKTCTTCTGRAPIDLPQCPSAEQQYDTNRSNRSTSSSLKWLKWLKPPIIVAVASVASEAVTSDVVGEAHDHTDENTTWIKNTSQRSILRSVAPS